ncbi:hypothetical protein BAU06_19240 [Bordetella bronchialis]|uniref:Uncharacterized protein n=1 Tax=Bordetella bronchialis TaxID=463025 RepID=A0ABN4R993_9BORD|nr:hypothetical protein BAU06_19240 [Bordetella bronchialis]
MRAEAKMTATSETIACLAGPVAFFELNLRRSLSNQQRLDYNQRKRAVLDATGEYRHDIDDLVTLRSKDGGGGSISIEWSDPPDMVVLDGVQVDISGLKGLVLPSGLHKIVAAGDAGIAVHNVRVSHGRVTKIYLPLRSYIQLSSKDLAAAVQERRWSDVLRATSNGVLRPRSVRLARAHWDALYGLGLSAWIDSSDIVAVGGKEGKKALTLRTIGEPLFDWDADLVRKAMNRCCD